jgi:hypothetical protein
MKLWEMNLRRLEDYPCLQVNVSDILERLQYPSHIFEKRKWNGRLIRNMINTAVALAHEDAKRSGRWMAKLESKHLDVVLTSSREFSKYLSGVHGEDEADRARKARIRIDDFPP